MVTAKSLKFVFVCLLTPVLAAFAVMGQNERERRLAVPAEQLPGEVVMLYSPVCGGCQSMLKEVECLQSKGYRLTLIDIEKETRLAERYQVRGVPTFVYMINGQEQFRTVSMMSPGTLANFCRGIRDQQ